MRFNQIIKYFKKGKKTFRTTVFTISFIVHYFASKEMLFEKE